LATWAAAGKLFAKPAHAVAVQDHGGTIYRNFDCPPAQARGKPPAASAVFRSMEVIANDSSSDVDCDILIPAALEQQITAANAPPHGAHDHRGRERPGLPGR
jgi:glutamate dehydrogenase (NAD(P)+)